VHVLAVDQLNTYDVLCADDVVFTKAAFDALVDRFQGTTASAIDTTPAEAVEVRRQAGQDQEGRQGRGGPGRQAGQGQEGRKADKQGADKPAKAKKADKADVEDDK
jgi:large subunit ribosomal protein L4